MLKVCAWPKYSNKKNNPYQFLLYSEVENILGVSVDEFSIKSLSSIFTIDVLHIHWPDVFLATSNWKGFWFKLCFLRGLFLLLQLRGVPIIWTVHNLKRSGQRNSRLLEAFFWPWFSSRVDGVIYMTHESKEASEAIYSRWKTIPNFVIPHGNYTQIIQSSNSSCPNANANAKAKPKLPGVLFFGSITKYKNSYQVLRSFLELAPNTSRLSIKGKMSENNPDLELLDIINSDDVKNRNDITFQDRFLSDEELVRSISDHDLVVFPYSDVMNSGAAIFALSVGRPILASNIPVFRELQGQVGSDWVYLIQKKLNGCVLKNALDKAVEIRQEGHKPDLSQLDWKVIAKQTYEAYRGVLAHSSGKGL